MGPGVGGSEEGLLSNVRLAPWTVAIWAALQAAPADAQGNIDAGKSPAQIFGDTCSACHRSAREFKRISLGFLRTHYATSSEEATAMANYLASVIGERGPQPKRPPAEIGSRQPADAGKQPGDAGKQPADAAKQHGDVGKQIPRAAPADQAKSTQGQPKGGRPGTTAQARPAAEERPPEPPPAAPARPAPALEPFEE